MENLIITNQHDDIYLKPNVSFDAQTGICQLYGESYIENTREFYDRLQEWLETFLQQSDKPLQLNIKLTYFNTSSSRALLDLFRVLKKHELRQRALKVTWYVQPGEDFMYEEVEDFILNTGLRIQVVTEAF